MLESQYLAIFGFASTALFAALCLKRIHDESAVLALAAGGGFGLLALRGDTVTVVTETGESVLAGSGDVQLFALALALVSLTTFLGSLRAAVDKPNLESLGRAD